MGKRSSTDRVPTLLGDVGSIPIVIANTSPTGAGNSNRKHRGVGYRVSLYATLEAPRFECTDDIGWVEGLAGNTNHIVNPYGPVSYYYGYLN